MKYRIPTGANLDEAFERLKDRARQENITFVGDTHRGKITASGQTVNYSVVGNMITITFPSSLIEMLAAGKVKALLDDVFY